MTFRESFVCAKCNRETSVELNDDEDSRIWCAKCEPETTATMVPDDVFDPMKEPKDHSGNIPFLY